MNPPTAPFWLRPAALVYDLFPLVALWMLTVALSLVMVGGDIDVAHPPAAFHFAQQVALTFVTGLYFVLSWARGGQTIGMRAWRLRVVTLDDSPLPWPRAVLRFVVAAASLGLGLLWCLVDREGRGWHDHAAGSRMLRVPAKKK